MTRSSQRLSNLPAYPFAVLNERVRQMRKNGIDVINLDIGSPDMPPMPEIIEVLARSAASPKKHGYSGYSGIPEFREAIARYYQKRFNLMLQPDSEVLPVIGSKEGIVNLSLALLDKGDVALVPDIGYPSYAMGAYLAGAQVFWLPMRAENGFLPDYNHIPADVLERARLMWVNYPNNPTGVIADGQFYRNAVAFCRKHDIVLASDNPYCDVTYDGYRAPSMLEFSEGYDHVVEFVSFSKTYNMAGWRLGAAVGDAGVLKMLLQVKSNVDSGHFIPIYEAGIAAIDLTTQAWLDERNAVYARRRDMLIDGLDAAGLHAEKPLATLYIWAKPEKFSASDYVERALTEAHVSMAPGLTYGPGGKDYVRISLSIADERIQEALRRLQEWYGKL